MSSEPEFDVCVAINYYAPYLSGLTEAARLIAEELAARGRRVAVVCAQHDPALPREEEINGVRVIRTPVVTRVSRGTVSPSFPLTVARVARRSRILHLHLPMLEAGVVAALAGRTPVLATYHLDLWLPRGLVNAIAVRTVQASTAYTLRRAAGVVVSSEDHVRSTTQYRQLRRLGYLVVPPPCADLRGGRDTLREGPGLHVGFLGRIVEEKGIEYLVEGFRRIPDPDARLLLGGEYAAVAGGSVLDRVRRAIGDDPRVRVLGALRGETLRDFFASIDVLALPSRTESFGMVQGEAMIAGVPVVASDVPGGRVPVAETGFGLLVPPGDPEAIATALPKARDIPAADRAELAEQALHRYGVAACADAYTEIIDRTIVHARRRNR
jgi:glycosyltransferase involved in cell wall biosynthesis